MKTGIFKRIVSAFLAGVMAFTSLASSISAETAQQGDGLSFDYSVEGNNSLAGMFADVLSEEGVTDPSEGYNGYIVNRVTMADNVATVEYSVIEDSTIIVSLFDEQGYEMLATANAQVSKDENKVTINFAADDIPEYYLLKAYVVDDNMRPKCKEYVTNDYTEAFVTMMSKTVEDFPEEQVLNIDESTTNNFMVYNEDVVQVPYVAERNVVVSADFENQVFVFDNIDETISALNPGEIFSYVYGSEDIIITEIVSVEINGTEATIYGKEVDMKEVFDFIKIDSTITDGEVIEGTEGEGVTYIESESAEKDAANGLSQTEQRKNGDDPDVEVFIGETFTFDLKEKTVQGDITVDDDSTDDDSFDVGFTGELELQLGGFMRIYFDGGLFNPTYKAEFVIEYDMTLTIGVEATFKPDPWELPDIMLFTIYGVNIVLNPELSLEISGKIAVVAEFTPAKRGFSIENNGNGNITKEINEEPELDIDIKIEVEIKVTLHLGLAVELIDESILNIELALEISVVITAEMGLLHYIDETAVEQHDCIYKGFLCVDGGIDLEISLVFEIALFDWDWTTIKYEPQNPLMKFHLADFYYSDAYKEFGWGECPYKSYRAGVRVTDARGSSVKGATVKYTCGDEYVELTTDALGIATTYLVPGTYTMYLSAIGYEDDSLYPVTVEEESANRTVAIRRTPSDITIKAVLADGTSAAGARIFVGKRNWGDTDENGKLVIEDALRLYEEYTFSVCNGFSKYYMEPKEILLESSTLTLTVETIEDEIQEPEIEEETEEDTITPDKIVEDTETVTPETPETDTDTEEPITPEEITVSVTVKDENGSPVSGATVTCGSKSTVTNENGVFEATGTTGTAFTVTVTKDGYLDAQKKILLDKNNSSVEVIIYKPTRTFEFTVKDSYGNLLEGASVTIDGKNATTDSDGYVKFKAAGDAQTATVSMAGYDTLTVDISGGNVFSATLSLTTNSAEDFTYSIIEDVWNWTSYVVIDSYIGDNSFVIIPSKIEGYPVTSIGDSAFKDCTSLTSVIIPDNVTSIEQDAFSGCSSLTNIKIPNSVTDIGLRVFKGCTSLTDITIPEGVTSIRYAFIDCISLKSITIPDGVKFIDGSFNGCTSLTEITIPDSILSIGDSTFKGCTNLTKITMPDSIATSDSIVSIVGDYAFKDCINLTSISIPYGVTRIDWHAFNGCANLTSITIPDSVTSIGDNAFQGCIKLDEVTLSKNLERISNSLFLNCFFMESITIPDNATSIGTSAFEGCMFLTTIIIPNSVTSIDINAFKDCASLTDVYYAGTEEQWSNISIDTGNTYLTDATIHYNYVPTETVDISYNSHDTMMAETVEVAYLNDAAITETIDVSRAVFSGLMPEKLYNFYVMVDKDAEAPFASANLLNIQQGTADSTGALTITYIGDERFDTADIFVVCEDPISIENAVVSEISLEYTGEMQYVDPVVTLDGKVLDSAEDYYITGEYCATNAGTYTYEVVGMGDYGGTVTATFTIAEATPIEQFVERLYTTMLGRASDPTGKANHVSSLNNGKTAAEVSAKFVTSAELKNKNLSNDEFVLRMYQTFMNRTPSAKEITRWATTLENGCTYEYVLKKFVASAEFKKLCGEYNITAGTYTPANNRDYDENITAFVSRMYTTLLGRSFDASGLNNNAGIIINGGTAADVGKKFVMSGELTNLKLNNDEFVKRMYQTFLNRTPSAKEITRWATTLENGCSYGYILKKFVASAEFNTLCTKYGISAGAYATTENRDYNENITAYVSRMYTKALGRSFDINGLNNNTGRLITGEMTAAEVAEYFILSKEFVNKKLTDEQFVTTLYSALFNRAPDASGKKKWLNKLATGTSREEVLKGFTTATEFKNLVKSFGL